MRSVLRGALPAVLAAAVSGCTVGPDYHAPQPRLPAAFVEGHGQPAAAPADPGSLAGKWWTCFGDATLDRLMETALDRAPDLREAFARVRQARAIEGQVTAGLFPTVNADGEYTANHGSRALPIGVPPGGLGPGVDSQIFQAGFDASWEIDVFGGTRRAIESARSSWQAAAADEDAAILSLAAETARTYFTLRSLQGQLRVARQNLLTQQDALHIATVQNQAGLAPILDVLRARAQVADTQALVPDLDGQARGAIYALGALVGVPPETLVASLAAGTTLPETLPAPPVGLPSELLRRRPDIRAAERRIEAATARIGVVTADLYPRFSLTGIAGLETLDASTFADMANRYYMAGPHVSWLLFDANRTRFRIAAERAGAQLALAEYDKTVLGALRDVETSLASYRTAGDTRNSLADECRSEQQAVDVATRLYTQGLVTFLTVLDAERTLLSAQMRLIQSRGTQAVNLVAVFKALGGGWNRGPA